ncbi:MAG: ATP-dependent 6-phosphofructokinase [Deltaproteobacteria bacterium]|nr:MAG: ATP-dependent 6-phosphofructokinase [Deltaproteobacteria bacterium]
MTLQPVSPHRTIDTTIRSLGPARFNSPLKCRRFVDESRRVLYDPYADEVIESMHRGEEPVAFEVAGPRERLFFDPADTSAAILTAGGLCPGLNDVIRALVHQLYFNYGVQRIKGVRFGFAGLNPIEGWPMLDLTPSVVRHIHEDGGTILGTSRGPQPVDVVVDTLEKERIDILFTIGGDGTLHGVMEIEKEITRRSLPIAVVGIPKTIDNDIDLVSRTFGFDTAVSEAVEAIRCAHTEAEGIVNGIGLVKLMGRESGFVAAHAALAEGDANFVLIPEVPFQLEGPDGFLPALDRRLRARQHAMVVVAEGAGQHLFDEIEGVDASGNRRLGDIGLLLKERISAYFRQQGREVGIKYIDPSYIIRSVPANPNDCIFCVFLAQNAAHAGLAGKTGVLVGSWHNIYVHVPIASAVSRRKKIDPEGTLWRSVLEATGQPRFRGVC